MENVNLEQFRDTLNQLAGKTAEALRNFSQRNKLTLAQQLELENSIIWALEHVDLLLEIRDDGTFDLGFFIRALEDAKGE